MQAAQEYLRKIAWGAHLEVCHVLVQPALYEASALTVTEATRRGLHSIFDCPRAGKLQRHAGRSAGECPSRKKDLVPCLQGIMCCADKHGAFVQPALYEAFGLTVVEAMSCGLPTFATIKGGPAEVLIADLQCS